MTDQTSGTTNTPTADPAPPAGDAPASAPGAVADANAQGATPPANNPAGDTSAAPPGAPEKYEFKPTEGITLGDAVLAKYGDVAKSLNLTQDQAQKVLTDVAPAIAQQQADQHKATVSKWESEARADKEFGGEQFDANLALAKRAIDAHFSPEFKALLDQTGLGNHPELIRGLIKVGKTVTPDRYVAGGSGNTAQTDFATRLYGSK